MTQTDGLILRGVGGFYYVRTSEGVVECRARGLFRKQGITPYAGDRVVCECSGGEGTVMQILPRRNSLLRPPVANLDRLVVVSSLVEPAPDLFLIDKMTAISRLKQIEPVIVFTKSDFRDGTAFQNIYRRAGFAAFIVSSRTGKGVDEVKARLSGGLSVFTGNSGVGKSSLLNCLLPGLELPTGEISRKLGRGRHTTRAVELYAWQGGYLADTPGFSSLDLARVEPITREELPEAFGEFAPYLRECRYNGCTHIGEKGCAVEAAVACGAIPRSRYESYVRLFTELKDIPAWEKKRTES